jgi:hypothetical protein
LMTSIPVMTRFLPPGGGGELPAHS